MEDKLQDCINLAMEINCNEYFEYEGIRLVVAPHAKLVTFTKHTEDETIWSHDYTFEGVPLNTTGNITTYELYEKLRLVLLKNISKRKNGNKNV